MPRAVMTQTRPGFKKRYVGSFCWGEIQNGDVGCLPTLTTPPKDSRSSYVGAATGPALDELGWRFWMIVGAFINKRESPRNFPALDYFPLVVN